MAKEMLINVSEGAECRIALLENDHLEELYMERSSSTSHVGNIYKGRVTNVEASIQAAFIDFGLGRNGFLHISDLMPQYFGRRGEDIQESVGRKMARRDRPPIQRCLRRGDEIIVQIIKEGIGTKGPTLTSYLSIPGRILVMMPGMTKLGVSRKIEDEPERRRLRTILDSLKPPKDVGFIIRTAGIGKSKADIQRDFTYLTRLYTQIEKKRLSGPGPMELYTEGDLVTRTVRDVFTSDVDRIIVDSKEVAERVDDVIRLANPRAKDKVVLYTDPVPIFHKYGIERLIEQMYSRHVPLPSGGSLVIDSTEAVVAIDVNSGKFRDHKDAETTAFKTDMEAADEIPRQLKLRDLGGVIICDFIDLRYERHRRELEKRLDDNFKNDRAKTKVLHMSQFGIIEITRQRMRPSLKRSIYFDCPHCKGSGLVKTPESMSLDVMRRLAIGVHDARVARVELAVCPDVAYYLQNRNRALIANMEIQTKKRILIRADQTLGLDEQKFELFDIRDGLVYVEELGMVPGDAAPAPQRRHQGQQGRGRGGRRGGKPREEFVGRPAERIEEPWPPLRHDAEGDEDRFDLDSAVEAIEEREEERDEALSHSDLRRSEPDSTPLAGPPQVLGEDEEGEIGDVEEALEAAREFEFGDGGEEEPEDHEQELDRVAEREDRDQAPEEQGPEDRAPKLHDREEDAFDDSDHGAVAEPRRDQRRGGGQRGGQQRGGQQRGGQERGGQQRGGQQRGGEQRGGQQRGGEQRGGQQRDRHEPQGRDRTDRQQRDNGAPQPNAGPMQRDRQRDDRRPDDAHAQPAGAPRGGEQGGPEGEFAGEGDGHGRRRRRRRGGRGRGRRGGQNQSGYPQDMPADQRPGDAGELRDDAGEPSDRPLPQPQDLPFEEIDAESAEPQRYDEESESVPQADNQPPPRRGTYAEQFWSTEPPSQRPPRPARPPEPASRARGVESEPPTGPESSGEIAPELDRAAAEPTEAPAEAAELVEADESEPSRRSPRGRSGGGRRKKTGEPHGEAKESESQAAKTDPAPARAKGKGRVTKPRAAAAPTRRRKNAKGDAESAHSSDADATPPRPSLIADEAPQPHRHSRLAASASDSTVKTAAADKHLIQDEPVLPEPPRRPRTYRDLDEIPDDLE